MNIDYAKRAVQLGHKVLSSVEHGFQGYYYETYELAQKCNLYDDNNEKCKNCKKKNLQKQMECYDHLKFIFGAEAYWVKDRHEKDRTNSHIILLAKNEIGRRSINRILSDANEDGYYYRPRVDIELLLSLPPNDVFITTACVAFWHYEDIEDIIVKLHKHFGENFMLEIQNHNTEKQKTLNKRIIDLSKKYKIEMIVGLDSHYIDEVQGEEREYVLEAKGIKYDDEYGWFMDYPDDKTVFKRFKEQNIFTDEQIHKAMDNTDILLTFEDIILDDNIKLPTIYPELSQEERNKLYSQLVTKKFKEYTKGFSKEEYDRYFEGVKNEVQVIKNTNMADYFLIDNAIVNRAIEKGGIITDSGRGSGVGYFTNTLLGFSKVDRFTSPIKLYPERFISESRILETRSLPDLDLNTGNPDVFAEAQVEILGEGHAYPMIAFGTFKRAAAFKMYAKAKKLNFTIANSISQQLKKYEEAVKYADDDEKDEIDVFEYVDEQYHSYIKDSEKYMGIISDKKKAPCAFLIYQGNIREEIGLIKCKSDSTNKEYITTVIDGAIAEKYKFLKNDLLKVDVVLLIDAIFKRANEKHLNVNELMEIVKDNDKVWDIYANGYTIGINQCEKPSTTNKLMNYKPRNISELSAFIAAIRPAFKTMYKKFESREHFSYGIKAFDNIIQTKEFPQSFILYQEQTMNTLNYAGFPLDECYGIIKAIAKKHPEKVRPLKARFIEGFKSKIMEDDNSLPEDQAIEMSEQVWKIIDDSCGYGFNSAHAFCMALDSLYNAYQKAYFTYEFYEVMLQIYSDKGKKDKVSALKQEMLNAFGIKEGEYKFGLDNRKFIADKENKVIYPSLVSLKGLSQSSADALYTLSQKKIFTNFYDLYKALTKVKSVDAGKRKVLIKIGYFNDFGSIKKIENFLTYIEMFYERKEFSKEKTDSKYLKYIIPNTTQTEKQYNNFDYDKALYQVWNDLEDEETPLIEQLNNELEYMGYIKTRVPNLSPEYAFIQEYECKYKNPKLSLFRLCNGDIDIVKVKRNNYDSSPILVGDIIKTVECSHEGRWFNQGKDEDGNDIWIQDKDDRETILKKWTFVR
jgi:DNA polymerase III alpha subunit